MIQDLRKILDAQGGGGGGVLGNCEDPQCDTFICMQATFVFLFMKFYQTETVYFTFNLN